MSDVLLCRYFKILFCYVGVLGQITILVKYGVWAWADGDKLKTFQVDLIKNNNSNGRARDVNSDIFRLLTSNMVCVKKSFM